MRAHKKSASWVSSKVGEKQCTQKKKEGKRKSVLTMADTNNRGGRWLGGWVGVWFSQKTMPLLDLS